MPKITAPHAGYRKTLARTATALLLFSLYYQAPS